MPGDFERQSAVLLGVNELLPHHPRILTDLVAALVDRVPLVAVVTGEEQRRDLLATLCDWGLPAHRVLCVRSSAIGLWVRDYGPSFVKRGGRVSVLDAEYWYPGRGDDDRFPTDFARLLSVPALDVPVLVEGGNVLSNGRGLALCSTTLLARNAKRYTQAQVLTELSLHYGFKTVACVRPLIGSRTGHADMFATFTSPDTLLVGKYDRSEDPANAAQLDQVEKFMKGVDSGAGPLKVERIPMPPHRDDVWRTYTNALYANDVVVVPVYAGVDAGLEREALDLYRRLLPGRQIVTVESTSLAKTGGALRCVSLNIPDLGQPLGPFDPAAHAAAAPALL
jgi:agmatine deiminase